MEKVRIALYTPLPGFANDLCDVLKLFFQVEAFDVNPEGEGGEPLRHDYQERGGVARSVMHLRGRSFAMEQALPQAAPGGDGEHLAVALKRVRKRLCKLSLYRLLKELTGAHPPWGALTGIRPTRLLCQAMEEGRSMEEAERYLESFFDVTPEKAALLARIVREQQKLPAPCTAQADVYISIPFCRTRCAYCSFPGEAVGKGGRIAPYLEALFGEMREGARLMDEVMARFPGAREYTVEAGRPDTITRGKLLALKRLGIGRISINPQTMNDETLRLIGRDHTARQTCEAFALARELGFDDINMDVIAGLPGEDEAAFARTMEAVRRLAPDSLTVHTLAIKRSSRLNLERAPLPDAAVAAAMVRLGEETAEALGLAPYYLYRQKYMAGQQQNVGYARPGAACLYNVDIMEETTSILAMGAGAISKRVLPDRELRIRRAPNVTNVSVYIDRAEEMARRKEILFTQTEGEKPCES